MDFQLATCRHLPGLTPGDDLLRLALEARGVPVAAAPWDAIDAGHGTGPFVCLRSTWDYHRRWPEFSAGSRDSRRSPAASGTPRAPCCGTRTRFTCARSPTRAWRSADLVVRAGCRSGRLAAVLRETGASRAVIKPRVSATAHGAYVVEPGRQLTDAEWAPLEECGSLVQAYVPEIGAGEGSLIFIDGEFSHAVLKRPAAGEFRVQYDFGGRIESLAPAVSLRVFAERVLAVVPYAWVYARVDVVETGRGPTLMELELIEPDLFLALCAGGGGSAG